MRGYASLGGATFIQGRRVCLLGVLGYPDRVPVICERAPHTDLPDIAKKKFLVPGTDVIYCAPRMPPTSNFDDFY